MICLDALGVSNSQFSEKQEKERKNLEFGKLTWREVLELNETIKWIIFQDRDINLKI